MHRERVHAIPILTSDRESEPADSHLCCAFLLGIANTVADIIAARCTNACALVRARAHTHARPAPCGPALQLPGMHTHGP